MADIADLAQEHIEREAHLVIAAGRKPVGIRANGVCHNCDATVTTGLLFCDSDCRDDWQLRSRAEGQRPRE